MSHTSRRRFAQSLAAATAMMPLSSVSAITPFPPPDIARATTELLRAHYETHIDSSDLRQIEKDVRESLPVVERLRSFKLDNGDAPDFL